MSRWDGLLRASEVRYTLDGSDPAVGGHVYTGPLVVAQTTVLRSVALQAGVPVSAVTTATYLIGETSSLPVLSLVTEPAHLWDDATGIYTNPTERGRAWERPVTVQWLLPEGEAGFSVDAGLRIHGGGGRTGSTKQSFRLYFRGEYGVRELAYPLFGDEPGEVAYDRLVLRAGYNDSWQCSDVTRCLGETVYVRDQLVRELHGAMGQVVAEGRWAVVYLNGEYWGLYNLTERIDEDFLATHFDASEWYANSASGEIVPGSSHQWLLFADWITAADLSDVAQYEQAVQQLDIENFTSYFLLNIWAQNWDWPGSNWIMARPREGTDVRWRFFVWDAEETFMSTENTLERVVASGTNLGQVLASLLQSEQYRAYFVAELERHLAGALSPEQVLVRLDTLEATLRPAMGAEAQRWTEDGSPVTYVAAWERALMHIRDFVTERGPILRAQVDQLLTSLAE